MEVYEAGTRRALKLQNFICGSGVLACKGASNNHATWLTELAFASQLAPDREQDHENTRSMTVPALRSKLIATIAPARIPEF